MATLTSKPLSWFKVVPQVRRHFDEAELRLLGESLKVKQLQPVIARSDGTLIAGGRRFQSALLVGLKELEVIIEEEPLTESQVRILQLTENIHRADLSDAEKWRAYEELLRLNHGWTNRDLSQHLKLSESTVTKYLSPSRCIKEVQEALETGVIGITTCYEMSRVPEDQQRELLTLRQGGASRDSVAAHVRKQKKPVTEGVRSKRIVCPLTSGVTITVTGKELSLDDVIEAFALAQKEARKAREQGLDSRTFGAVMRDKSNKS
jgi:ParB/RepB/Spo0J family partition protein